MSNGPIRLQPGDIEIEAWLEPNTDKIYIKVRQHHINGDIRGGKRGGLIRLTPESLYDIAEGEQYPLLAKIGHKSTEVLK